MCPPAVALLLCLMQSAPAPQWSVQTLDSTFRAEGCAWGDLDRDGQTDLVAAGRWYAGPSFEHAHDIAPGEAFDPAGYSDHFFDFVDDLDGDGWVDVLVVGFPGEAARWYRNPGQSDGGWIAHDVLDEVSNESPAYVDLSGDGVRDLVCIRGGRWGWASIDRARPDAPWTFHALSPDLQLGRFTHGMGVGDVDGDGRQDLLEHGGWWRQPADLSGDPVWERHAFAFGESYGGAQMFATDIDGDGDADVLTSLAAHDFGLSWFEQVRSADGAIDFREHRFVDDTPDKSPHGVRFGEIHALALCDVDGDGLEDLVTGKRWWSHGAQGDPEPGAPAALYVFTLRRTPSGVDFVPQLVGTDSGVGVDVRVATHAGGARVAIAVSNKRGTFVYRLGAPAPRSQDDAGRDDAGRNDAGRNDADGEDAGGRAPRGRDGGALDFDFESGSLEGWTRSGDAFEGQPIEGDTVRARGREASLHHGRYWIGGYERRGDDGLGTLTSPPFVVDAPFASFLVGGGARAEERVEIVRCDDAGEPTGEVLFKSGGADFESLQRVVVDLSAQQGALARVRLVDQGKGHWGHVNFDDLRLHDERPTFARPQGVPPIFVPDPPKPAGLSPQEAARAMTVPEGFQVELVAAEPDLHQPIAFTFDSRGRIWVVEAFTYPQRAPEGQGKDDVIVLEDKDGDGRFESRTVFIEGLNLVSGLEVGYGGVWIGAAPYLLFVPDRDDDLVPDGTPQVVLDGWGYEDTHETLNAFTWGPDGWLYGCHGVFTKSRVGAPGTPDGERTPINAGIWRYHPTRRTFEVFAWGTSNPWGIDFDDRGQAFCTACVIPHLFHVVQGARYIRQAGEHFDPYSYGELDTIADHGHWQGANPWAGNARSDAVGGGHAHCGLAIYLGDNFPAAYRGALLFDNIHGNRLNHDEVERRGSGFVGHHRPDFLLANDQWFRSVAQKVGPDGAVYFIDWYDKQACHWTEVERWDRTNGRLYRVHYGNLEPVRVVLPDLASDQLVAHQLDANDWWVRRARLVLSERGPDADTHAQLRSILRHNTETPRRLRALWALACTDGIDEELARQLLAERDEDLAAWGVQLAVERGFASERFAGALVKLAARTTSPVVRLYLAAALPRLEPATRWNVAAQLVRRAEDADDANVPWMLWWGLEDLVAAEPVRALGLASTARIPLLLECTARRCAEIDAALEPLVQTLVLESDPARRLAWLTGMERSLRARRDVAAPPSWPILWSRMADDPDAHVRELALSVAAVFADPAALPRLREVTADAARPIEERQRALERLAHARDAAALPQVLALLATRELRADALRALASFPDGRISADVLAHYGDFDAQERRAATALLCQRVPWATALLDGVDAGVVAKNEVHAAALRSLRALGDPGLAARAEILWGRVRSAAGDKQERIAELTSELTPQRLAAGDLHRGRSVFDATCAQCHTLYGHGGDLAPDLTGSGRADLSYLLENVVDPSAVVGVDYLETIVFLKDGRSASGIAKRVDDQRVVLATQIETLDIARGDIEELRESGLSAMPDGLLDTLTDDEIRDLVAYLGATRDAAPMAQQNQALFDGASLSGWSGDPALWSVRDGEIVGRSGGLERNAFLTSEVAARDFKLTLDVRLVGGAGNSGIQFRSQPAPDGEMAGYQADVGAGWWGKLYEENGRAVLSAGAGEAHVRPDDWNTYEITATGSRVRTVLNGVLSVDLEDPAGSRAGVFGLQIHSGGPTEVRFRNLKLELDPEPLPALANAPTPAKANGGGD